MPPSNSNRTVAPILSSTEAENLKKKYGKAADAHRVCLCFTLFVLSVDGAFSLHEAKIFVKHISAQMGEISWIVG